MALLWMDSFDHYVTADIAKKWTNLGTQGSGTTTIGAFGRHSSQGIRHATTSANASSKPTLKVVSPTSPIAIVGFGFQTNSFATAGSASAGTIGVWDRGQSGGNGCACLLFIMNGNLVQGAFTLVNGTGQIRYYRADGTLVWTSTGSLGMNVFQFLEFKITLSPTVGTIDVIRDGVALSAPATGLNTGLAAAWSGFVLGRCESNVSVSMNWDFDDVYVCDGAGSAPWNTFLGDCRVDVRVPTAEGTTIGWTPLSGSDNALMVDEALDNGDTDYNATSTLDAIDTFVVQDAPIPGAAIYGVQHVLNMKKADAGVCTVAPVIRHSTTDYPGTALSPSMTYAPLTQVQPTNPGTAAQWIEADFNAAEFGYKRVS